MKSQKVDLSKQVDDFSTQLVEFSENLTEFTGLTKSNSETILTLIDMIKGQALKLRDIESEITDINESVDERFETVDELSKKYKKILNIVERNSKHIETLSSKIKKKGKESLNSESKTINIKDVESEFKSISKTLEDFTNPHLTTVKNSYGPVFPGSLELSAKHTQDFKDLSEILKTLFTISKANSENITALKESMGEEGNKPLLQSDTDFKEDEEPTARMMELVSSFVLNYNYIPHKLFIGNNHEIFVVINSKIYVYNKEGSLLREITSSNHKFMSGISHSSGNNPMYNIVINNNKIFFTDLAQYQTDIFDIQGNYIETVPQRVSNNGILYSLFRSTNVGNPPVNYIGKYPSGDGDGKFRYQYSVRDVVISDNGYVFVSDRQKLLRIQVFDSEGNFLRKFPIEDTLYNKYKFNSNNGIHNTGMNIFENQLYIKSGHEDEYFNNNINVYSLEGKFIYKFSCGTEQRPEVSTFTEKTLIPILNFNITSSGEFCILYNKAGSIGIKIYKRGYSYIQRPLERKYKIYTNYQVEKDLESLVNKKFLSIQFPLCIYQYYWLQPRLPIDSYNKNLLTHTIYFEKPQSVKKAIQQCEEYFNEPVTRNDFQDLQSHCLLGYIEGRFASRELNWATCNRNRLCRGYFLGGNVLSGVKITEDHGLVLDITQD